ncbi:MAG: 16S rRNA (guanine(527)-N(7))-methyltransferase RsmG [Chloroflexota bacterium]
MIRGLADLEITPSDPLITAFAVYLSELKKWNRAYSLTSLKDDRDIIVKHFFDSLLFLRVIPSGRERLADVGSGAGFPGLPLALVRPDIEVALVEPSRKKCAFLRHITRKLGTGNVEVLESRAEEIRDRRFDCIVTRALFSIAELAKRSGHLLERGGCFILSKGPKLKRELETLPETLEVTTAYAALPEGAGHRILVVAKTRVTRA